jgi:hypothetical protein
VWADIGFFALISPYYFPSASSELAEAYISDEIRIGCGWG